MAEAADEPRLSLAKNLTIGAILIPFFIVFLFPFVVMVSTSLKTDQEVYQQPPTFLPNEVVFENYRTAWSEVALATYFRNSLLIGLGTALLALVLAIPAAYALARFRFRFRQVYLFSLLVIQMFSPVVIVLALFKLISSYHLLNYLGTLVVINAAFGLSYAVWLLTGYFQTIPAEIEEAAMVDGASRLRAVLAMTMPLSWPGIVAAAIFTFMGAWNEFLFALTFITEGRMRTLPTGIYALLSSEFYGNYPILAASLVLFSVPVLALYFLFQQQFIEGLTAGALKQ
jgi:multiple sugar transport system permease protein